MKLELTKVRNFYLTSQAGFTLVESLVGMLVFSLVGLGFVVFSSDALQGLGAESRLSSSALELKNAVGLLTTELKMNSSVSPYLPGDNTSLSNCSGTFSVTSTTVKFLVVEDDPAATATSGIKSYYVGYKYDSTTGELLRGEIQAPSVTACTLPAGDPTSSTYAKTIAKRLTTIDADGNGSLDSVFSLSGEILSINLGAFVTSTSRDVSTQKIIAKAFMRTLS